MFPHTAKVLIVDDTALMRRMMRDLFHGLGYKNLTDCNNGELAWKEIEKAASIKSPFDVIISDWNMPVLSGLELLKKVRCTPISQNIPFIMLTAETERDKVIEAVQAGVNSYITKPFTPDTVKAKLGAVWEKLHPSAPSTPPAKAKA